MTVKCELPSTGVSTLLSLVISRVLHSNPNAPRVEVVSAGPHQNNGNPSLIPGSSVTGTVDGNISQNFISLTMSQAKCRDAGMYICEALYLKPGTGNIPEALDVSRNLTVEGTDWLIVFTVEASCLSLTDSDKVLLVFPLLKPLWRIARKPSFTTWLACLLS